MSEYTAPEMDCGMPSLELNEIYKPATQKDEEQRRQQQVATQLLKEWGFENSSSEYYYNSSFDESDWYLLPGVKKDPEEVKKIQLEAKKVWIEMHESVLFFSYGINHLPVDNFETISQGFGIAVLASGKEVLIPLISPSMVNPYYGCYYMQLGDYKYERELKSLDRFGSLSPCKEELKCAQKVFGALLPEMESAWRGSFTY